MWPTTDRFFVNVRSEPAEVPAAKVRSGAIRGWRAQSAFALATLAAIAWSHRDAWASLARTWYEIETYSHGPLVLLASAYLVFALRRPLIHRSPGPSWTGFVAVLGVVVIGAIGNLAGVLALQHFAALASLPAVAFAYYGAEVMRIVVFPALYLFLAVPFGEVLLPGLIAGTAAVSVSVLQAFGIPVYVEGPFINIPSGTFHVVKACSGIRYLLASVSLGAVFAYVAFRSTRRRLLFMAICILVPIVANWIRATGIILIAHWSDMRLAAGVDHLIYGWLFFGVVMLIVFLIGSRFAENLAVPGSRSVGAAPLHEEGASGAGWIVSAAFMSMAVLTTVAVSAQSTRVMDQDAPLAASQAPEMPDVESWRRTDPGVGEWSPSFPGADSIRIASYRSGAGTVDVLIARYADIHGESDVVSSNNQLFDSSAWWLTEPVRTVSILDGKRRAQEYRIGNGVTSRLVWAWYVVGDAEVHSALGAKFLRLKAALIPQSNGMARIALSAPAEPGFEAAQQALAAFLADGIDCIRMSVRPGLDVPGKCGGT